MKVWENFIIKNYQIKYHYSKYYKTYVVTLIAITLTVSGEKARMKAKDHVGFLILGIAGVLLAPVITSTIMYWFGK